MPLDIFACFRGYWERAIYVFSVSNLAKIIGLVKLCGVRGFVAYIMTVAVIAITGRS